MASRKIPLVGMGDHHRWEWSGLRLVRRAISSGETSNGVLRTRVSGFHEIRAPRNPAQRNYRGCGSRFSGRVSVGLERVRGGFVLFSFLSIVPVMPVAKVVPHSREGVANGASDQSAEASADQARYHPTARGLIPGGSRPKRGAGAEADQSSEWRESGWTRCKCRGIGLSAGRWHGSARRSREWGGLGDDFIFAGLLSGLVRGLG
jgi:hypothetical protein